jgi:hypothetical protein
MQDGEWIVAPHYACHTSLVALSPKAKHDSRNTTNHLAGAGKHLCGVAHRSMILAHPIVFRIRPCLPCTQRVMPKSEPKGVSSEPLKQLHC